MRLQPTNSLYAENKGDLVLLKLFDTLNQLFHTSSLQAQPGCFHQDENLVDNSTTCVLFIMLECCQDFSMEILFAFQNTTHADKRVLVSSMCI